MWDVNEEDTVRLLEVLFRISGMSGQPRQDDYQLVASCLHDRRSEIRERAILIAGLGWKDPTVLGYFHGALDMDSEPDDENRRLMIECLVSFNVASLVAPDALAAFLQRLILRHPRSSMTAKAAYVGVQRLHGRMDDGAYAGVDYDQLQLDADGPHRC